TARQPGRAGERLARGPGRLDPHAGPVQLARRPHQPGDGPVGAGLAVPDLPAGADHRAGPGRAPELPPQGRRGRAALAGGDAARHGGVIYSPLAPEYRGEGGRTSRADRTGRLSWTPKTSRSKKPSSTSAA